mgnify:FL=1
MADVFDVVADPTRRDIVRLLHGTGRGEMSVGELVEALGITQPTVSKHLKVLREGGVVDVREEGQHRYYRFQPAALAALEQWLNALGNSSQASLGEPYTDLSFAGRAVGGALRDLQKWVEHTWGRFSR